jgi:hypothetical protein
MKLSYEEICAQAAAMLCARALRRMPHDQAVEYLQSAEWLELPEDARDLVYVADARLEEIERVKRQKARQAAAEENYRRRMAAERGETSR